MVDIYIEEYIGDNILNTFEKLNTSNISSEKYDLDFEYIPLNQRPETYIVPIVFSLILIVGVVGNGILILILLCNSNMRNIPNTYVLSLAWGDLLVSTLFL